MKSKKITVTGAGGMIGGHLIKRLLDDGHDVVAVDIKGLDQWYQVFDIKNIQSDLSYREHARYAVAHADEVYNLACNMGGMGFIHNHKLECLHSVDITSSVFRSSFDAGVSRIFQSSSACIYPEHLQDTERVSLKESDAWPALPDPCYGLEKLYGEEFAKQYSEKGIVTRVARYHNVYGTHSTYRGGREKAPAAICRKVIEGKFGDGTIEIWGDGNQTRSFCYIDDCIDGTVKIMHSDVSEPINLGSSELVSINELVDIVEDIAEVKLKRSYKLDAPQGVRGRNSDNTMIKERLGWEPSIPLRDGMEKTYAWIYDQMQKELNP